MGYIKRTAEEIEGMFFGSGFTQWSWWENAKPVSRIFQDSECVDWAWEVKAEDPNEEGFITKRITPADIIKAVERIYSHGDAIPYMSAYTTAECGNFLYGFEEVNFDADTADQVMQMIVYDSVLYC
ncbi:hypothetical protein ADL27_32550 [Streptomyces sp. NRRL F-6602]|nr:hypothetical protein ADL27_32550 [Streptomyces sp. NRRL F-6602]